jgi:hypothetical protein
MASVGAGFNAEVAHGTELQVIDEGVQRFFLFAVGCTSNFVTILMVPLGQCQFAGRASCAAVLIGFRMQHHHLSAKSFRQFGLKLRILFRYYFLRDV